MVPNGIDTESIEMKTEWNDARNLLFMSRIHPKKGLEILIDALSITKKLNLTIAGDGDYDYVNELKKLVVSKNLENRIRFVGPIYGDKKWEMIRQADVVALTSYSENFGLIVAEALASGTPVLTTTGTPWESIKERNCGWWGDANVESVKVALCGVENTLSSALNTMGVVGRQLIAEKFDVRTLADSLLNIYLDFSRKC